METSFRAVGGVVLTLALGSCTGKEPPAAVVEPPRPVKYVEVVAERGGRTRTFTGFAKADVRSKLGFRVSGTVRKIHVEQGDVVQKGDVIAELDSADFEIKVREVEAALAEARAQEVLAQANYHRIQRLYEKDNASQGDFDSALARLESTRAGLESVGRKLQQAQRQMEYTELRAPAGSAIATVRVEEGEIAQSGAPVVEINSGQYPQVEIAVPEGAIADIRQGASARVRFPTLAGKTFSGRVRTIGVVPGEGVTTYPVTIELNRSWVQLAGRSGAIPLRPGMAAEVEMGFARPGSSVRHVVPATAVGADRQGRFVYVAQPDGGGILTASKRRVETGRLVPAGIEVTSGLVDGDKVITAGLNRIKSEQPVRLLAQD